MDATASLSTPSSARPSGGLDLVCIIIIAALLIVVMIYSKGHYDGYDKGVQDICAQLAQNSPPGPRCTTE